MRQAAEHPHLAARGSYTEHHGVPQPGTAPRFSATPGALRTPPARPGEHTAEVARDWAVPGLDAPAPQAS
jgi:alpha-methylacyl-CoA racemase